jgi:hypothetical protein
MTPRNLSVGDGLECSEIAPEIALHTACDFGGRAQGV